MGLVGNGLLRCDGRSMIARRATQTFPNGRSEWRLIGVSKTELRLVELVGREGRNKTKGSVGGGGVSRCELRSLGTRPKDEKRDCAVARRLEVSIALLGGREAI